MGDLDKYIQKISNLDVAIENALNDEGREVVKKVLVEAARKYVYDAYAPKFNHRRNGSDGILDEENIHVAVHGNELIAMDMADWQHLLGGAKPNMRLAEGIASGSSRFYMQNAGPRPFHEKAKEMLIMRGDLEDAVRRGLARQGYDTSGIKFKFI